MKKGLLGSTALVGAAVLAGGVYAAEAPEWKLSGNMNFQFYWVDQDANSKTGSWVNVTWSSKATSVASTWDGGTLPQEHDWYFGVDEAELALNVSGTADNGLNYGFKIEIQVNTSDGTVADEARIQLSGGWGTLQLGDEDGAEDTMNYGGENLMGATGGFDGDQGDYLYRVEGFVFDDSDTDGFGLGRAWGTDPSTKAAAFNPPSSPSIAGDTSDATKITYYSPRFSGFQVGASITPTPNNGDDFKEDGAWENHYGLGANYDNSFGNLRVRASAVYSTSSYTGGDTKIEDVSAWSLGGIVGWGPFSLGANYTDNGDLLSGGNIGISKYHWNVAAGFETGPLYFSAGYFQGVTEMNGPSDFEVFFGDEWVYSHIALTADYTIAPGLASYAEINFIEDEVTRGRSHETTSLILGVKASF